MRARLFLPVLALVALPVVAADETCPASWDYAAWNGVCLQGKKQSPIWSILRDRTRVQELPLLTYSYGDAAAPVTAKNTGTEIKAIPMFDGIFKSGDAAARLVQFHFHTPMEHSIDDWSQAVAELHLVHERADGLGLFVVAVPIRLGASNAALESLRQLRPSKVCHSAASRTAAQMVSMKALLPADSTNRYITYEGSLTSLPCVENVTWFLLNNGITATEDQLNAIRVIANNARPTQELHGRPVRYRVP